MDDRYETQEILGQGGMAYIYRAKDNTLQRNVAIKFLKESRAQSDVGLSRFYGEAYLMAQLGHPGIIPVYDLGVDGIGRHYYSMQQIDGLALSEIFSRRTDEQVGSRRVMNRLISLFITICETVGYAHKQGILHRDLKPANIMVDHFDNAYVMDWGLAKKTTSASPHSLSNTKRDIESGKSVGCTQDGIIIGTPGYLSPEQAAGNSSAALPQSDVFSLGVILYELITSKRPFTDESDEQMLQEVLHKKPVDPASLNRVVPKGLSAICMKALSKDPSLRYSNATELASDLKNYRSHLPTVASPPNKLEQAWNWGHRHRGLAGVVAASILFSLCILGAVAWQSWDYYSVSSELKLLADECRPTTIELEREHEILVSQLNVADPTTRPALQERLNQLQMSLLIELMSHTKRLARRLGFSSHSPPEKVLEELHQYNLKIIKLLLARGEEAAAKRYATTLLAGRDEFGFTSRDHQMRKEINSILNMN